ncbi:MAG: methyltransferase domain-containing protein [Chloroflexota bacterium]|nr:methyltransferase domain-containing protein [Chloroflexota bacterium]
MNTYWDAEVYDRIGKPMRGWARQVIDDLALRGDETVLDAGCGSGSVTFDLLEKLPEGKVYALDASAEMIASLRKTIAERSVTNVMPIQASLTDFTLPERVDCVFSNAVFHWIPDDEALFGCLSRATKSGGRLRAQCGGFGNNAHVLEAVAAIRQQPRFAPHLRGFSDSKKYRTPEAAKASLEQAGWREVKASLFAAPVPFEDRDEAALYIRTILLRDHIARLPESERGAYSRAVVDETIRRHGEPYVADYVRLDLWASK